MNEFMYDEREESIRHDIEIEIQYTRDLIEQKEELEDQIRFHACTEESEEGCVCHDLREEIAKIETELTYSII